MTYTSVEAHVPATGVAYQSGALYEIAFAAALALLVVAARRRMPRPGQVLWTVLGLFSLGRFLIFFAVRDVPVVALGLRQAQWTSIALMLVGVAGLAWTLTRAPSRGRAWPATRA